MKITTKRIFVFILVFIFMTIFFSGFLSLAVYAAQTRNIEVHALSKKGEAQNIQLYDYTAAFVIGIDRYANLDSSDQLKYAVNDAKGIEEILRENYQFNEIVTL